MLRRATLADRLFQFIAFVIPMGRLTSLLGESFSVVKITMVALFFLALARLASGDLRMRRSPLDIPIFVFCLAFVPSYFLSDELGTLSLVLATCFGYALMNSLAFNALDGEESVERILDAYLLGCALVTGLAFAQYATGKTLIPNVGRSELYQWGRTIVIIGTDTNPNSFAAHYLFAIPVALARMLSAGRSLRGAVWTILFALFWVTLFLTVSRAGILGAGLGCALVIVLTARSRGAGGGRKGVLFSLAALSGIGFFLLRNPEYGLGAIFYSGSDYAIGDKAEAMLMRRELFAANLRLFVDSPLFGVGFDMAQRLVVTVSSQAEALNPHNSLLAISSELGLLGLSSYLSVLAVTAICARRAVAGGGAATVGLCGAYLAQVLFGFAHMSYIAASAWLVPSLLCLLSDKSACGARS